MSDEITVPAMPTGLRDSKFANTAAVIAPMSKERVERLILEITSAAKYHRISPVHVIDMVNGLIEGHARRAQILRPDGKVAQVFAQELHEKFNIPMQQAMQEAQGYFAQRMRRQLETVEALDPDGPLVHEMMEIVERARIRMVSEQRADFDAQYNLRPANDQLPPAENIQKPQEEICKICSILSNLNPLRSL